MFSAFPACRTSACHVFVVLAATWLGLAERAEAENWPQWRGPRNNGVSSETNLPVTWSKSENILWRASLPGPAGATPVVWDDKIFLTSAKGQELVLVCLNTSGKVLWERKVGSGDQPVRGDEGNMASPSPSTDGKHVWAFMGSGDLACYTVAGKQVWQLNVGKRFGPLNIAFGMTSTPVLDGNRLYLQLLHTNGALVIALDALTGKNVWVHKRPSDAKDECLHSYASPILYRDNDQEFLLVHGADYITAHSLKDGKELWRCGGLNPPGKYNHTLRFVASPAVTEGLIVVPSAKNGPILALEPASHGDITSTSQGHVWRRDENTPDVPSPLIYGGLVYLCRESGLLLCLDAQTGREYYYERTHSHRHRASPVYADGKIYLTARDGVVTVVKAGREFEILATNELDEAISSSPAISNGRIYLRAFDALYCIGSNQPAAK
ncbi:MAG TPA: PQQ-binding-like beta-propeller repeat protein [Pirellulales bacterium]|jgi:outer membrane protein assembly factor BamB|nr:PQQ-binding-like beta-propeller repeat protein [Pirellulales bacterium]